MPPTPRARDRQRLSRIASALEGEDCGIDAEALLRTLRATGASPREAIGCITTAVPLEKLLPIAWPILEKEYRASAAQKPKDKYSVCGPFAACLLEWSEACHDLAMTVFSNCHGLEVHGDLVVYETPQSLPKGLRVHGLLDIRGGSLKSVPADLRVDARIMINHCQELEGLPPGIGEQTGQGILQLHECGLKTLPEGIRAKILGLNNCSKLVSLPAGLDVESLSMEGCTAWDGGVPEDARIQWINTDEFPYPTGRPFKAWKAFKEGRLSREDLLSV